MREPSRRAAAGIATLVAGLWILEGNATAAWAGGDVGAGQLAQVVALSGDVFAQSPWAGNRRLACNDPVEAGETVTTSPEAQVALLAADVYAELGGGSVLQLRMTAEAGPEFRLQAGDVRVIDTRKGGELAPFHLATPQLEAHGLGSDTEAWVDAEGTGAGSRICERTASVRVFRRRTHQAMITRAGECTQSERGAHLRLESEVPPGVRVNGAPACAVGDVVGPLAAHFAPGDVAAPPVAAVGFPAPPVISGLSRQPCDDPGLPCAASVGFGERPGLEGGGFPGSGPGFGEPPGLAGGPFPGSGAGFGEPPGLGGGGFSGATGGGN